MSNQTFKIKEWYEVPKDYTGIVEFDTGTKYWYLNGKLHRVDGPAIEYNNGTKLWYLNGKYHREDGPAIESANGPKFWFLNGKYFPSQDEWQKELNLSNLN